MLKSWIYYLLILIFALIGIKALFHPGLYTAHDIWHQVSRFYYYSQAVKDGQFPPYWVGQLANHFGYPLFFFSYHLPWLFGLLFLKLGFDLFNTIKILFALSFISSGFTMFFLAKLLFKDKLAALISAILYLWMPYHFLIIFVGATMGTAFVFPFLPLIFLGIYQISQKSKWGIINLAISVAGISLSQVMNLVYVFPITSIFTIWAFRNSKSKLFFSEKIILGILIGFLIAAFYLFPAAINNRQTRFSTVNGLGDIYQRNFIDFKQLVYSKWGFSPIINNAKEGAISLQLGIAQWISIIGILFLIFIKKEASKMRYLSIYLMVGFLMSVFLMLDYSKPVWDIAVKFTAIDFPFRFLLPASFIASLAAGIIIIFFKSKFRIISAVAFIIICLYTNRNYINVNEYINFSLPTYLNLLSEVTTTTNHEYLPLTANQKLFEKPWKEIIGKDIKASNTKQTTQTLTFNTQSQKAQVVSIGQFYFPGQTLYLDSQKKEFTLDKEGRISLTLPSGNHQIIVKFEPTKIMVLSRYLSIIGILTLAIFFIKNLLTI